MENSTLFNMVTHLAVNVARLEKELDKVRKQTEINEADIYNLDERTQVLNTLKEALRDE